MYSFNCRYHAEVDPESQPEEAPAPEAVEEAVPEPEVQKQPRDESGQFVAESTADDELPMPEYLTPELRDEAYQYGMTDAMIATQGSEEGLKDAMLLLSTYEQRQRELRELREQQLQREQQPTASPVPDGEQPSPAEQPEVGGEFQPAPDVDHSPPSVLDPLSKRIEELKEQIETRRAAVISHVTAAVITLSHVYVCQSQSLRAH